jgi:hypothetical protein
MAIYVSPSHTFFDQLALIDWRHGSDVLSNVREARNSSAIGRDSWEKSDDFKFLASMAEEIDFLASTAKGTIAVSCKWNQNASFDSFLGLFQSAARGKALNTRFQFHSFLSLMGVSGASFIELPADNLQQRQISLFPDQLLILSGGHCHLAMSRSLQDIWVDINTALEENVEITSVFDLLNLVRDNLISKIEIRALTQFISILVTPELAPSTREWVHGFVLWTGISPPAEVSGSDVIDVRCAQKPRAMENYRDFLCRQKNRTGGARTRRSRSSRRNCGTRCSQNRYFESRRNFGRNAFRRSWANCQDAWYQAA